MPTSRFSKTASLLIVTFAYLVAFAGAAISLYLLRAIDWHPLWKLALADSVGTIIVYFFSVGFKNSSFYDPYWSVAPPVFLLFLLPLAELSANETRQLLVCAAVILWAIRLTLNWGRHWPGIQLEDWRYVKLKQKGGLIAFTADFFGIHFFPTLMVFLGCLPLYPALIDNDAPLSLLDIAAFLVCLIATGIELLADEQLRLFKERNADPLAFMQSGIWKYTRHPNYFGEWLFWVGIFGFGMAANDTYWWTGVGMVMMLVMFLAASIPLMDQRMKEKRPAYSAHAKKVSGFFPLPRRK